MRTSHKHFRKRAGLAWLVALLIMIILSMTTPDETMAEPCVSTITGLDLSNANSHASPEFGGAVGQTFLAADTLIQAITLWRAAFQQVNNFGWHLYILETDSTGAPAPDGVILDGPTIWNSVGDGVNPIPFRFEFDPPFALPGPGTYELAILGQPCDGGFEVLGDNTNSYADGQFWKHGHSAISGCIPRNFPRVFPSADLVFEIEFCDTGAVPVLPQTWGRVKESYR